MLIFDVNKFYDLITKDFYNCLVFLILFFVLNSFLLGCFRLLLKDIQNLILACRVPLVVDYTVKKD